MESKKDWSIPVKIHPFAIAFPATVIGEILPPLEDIPTEFRNIYNEWCKIASKIFYEGMLISKSTIIRKPHITDEIISDCWGQLAACSASYEPKHEHKISGMAYLLSLWFEKIEVFNATNH